MRHIKSAPRGRIDRRTFVGGLGAALTLAGAGPARSIGRLAAGDGELIVVSDGSMTLPVDFAFPDVPADEVRGLLEAAGQSGDGITNACNVTLLRRGDRLAIFDVGAGPNFLPTTGELLDNLAEAGVDPAEVTDVIFTHAHPDHLWGLTDDFDDLVFPEARYHMARAERDFWMSPEAMDALPEERQSFVVGAQNRIPRFEEQASFFEPGDEVIPGVEAIDTAGHTPGHVSFAVHGGDGPVIVVGDAVTNVVLSLERPDWPSGADQDVEKGVKTRTALLDRLAGDKARVIGFHFPHPGAGLIERKNGGYRFVPA
ncbi:MAG: MBL fold metallo-hydrolase [Rhizobiaceae bacterium]|nr:MBL fold metallo-hydrolase [Rhizobiaceae bacterium]MCV0405400.1 MBL fold metallo-hydrolase [Rhizobiaceae bacterium]